MIFLYFAALIIAFVGLFKCAGLFVEGSCKVAEIMKIPKMIVGIVLVSLATTAPEFGVSVISASLGELEFALGNAVGSVICDDGVALALAAVVAPTAILINCRILKFAGAFLLSVDFLAFFLAKNGTISRGEGIIFISILIVYFIFMIRNERLRWGNADKEKVVSCEDLACEKISRKQQLKRPLLLFTIGLIGVAMTSFVVVWAARNIAIHFLISKTVIGLTVIAIGTSLPEISTCIVAALKKEGEIAVGNIIGADILNILWIIGMSSIVRPIQVELEVISFTFPYMILVVTVMLVSMRLRCRLGRVKGILLFCLYLLYLFFVLTFFI